MDGAEVEFEAFGESLVEFAEDAKLVDGVVVVAAHHEGEAEEVAGLGEAGVEIDGAFVAVESGGGQADFAFDEAEVEPGAGEFGR